MFFEFLYQLRGQGIPASLHEYLNLMDALSKNVIQPDVNEFYVLSRAIFVKSENQLDAFDRVFDAWFKEKMKLPPINLLNAFNPEWLKKNLLHGLSPEEKKAIEEFGDFDALMDRLKELLKEQNEEHNKGNKWIGTGGTSPFGSGGYNPKGHRLGNKSAGNRTAVKVWENRTFKNLSGNTEINTRNIKVALKYLRHFSREGLPTELNLDKTIDKTSQNAGMLDIVMQPSKKNKVKVLMLMDVGGSMDDHIAVCEQLFSAAKYEFKHLEFFYFHNCIYEHVWPDNRLRWTKRIPTIELMHKFGKDYKFIIVGDAAMSPYELYFKGGGIDQNNEIPGIHWMQMLSKHFKHFIWLNPIPETNWNFFETVDILRKFTNYRMFPTTINGLIAGMKCLKNPKKSYKKDIWGDF